MEAITGMTSGPVAEVRTLVGQPETSQQEMEEGPHMVAETSATAHSSRSRGLPQKLIRPWQWRRKQQRADSRLGQAVATESEN
jgi:hypothetical protein